MAFWKQEKRYHFVDEGEIKRAVSDYTDIERINEADPSAEVIINCLFDACFRSATTVFNIQVATLEIHELSLRIDEGHAIPEQKEVKSHNYW